MRYQNIVEGVFIKRINRFIAKVLIDDNVVLVHVKNTGRCKELFLEGAKVYLEKSENPNRKTAYSLISIYKNGLLINIDSQVPNAVVYEGIMAGKVEELSKLNLLKREVTYSRSRFDLYYETPSHKGFIEIKGVTLEQNGLARFPDAPTERGRKHLMELVTATKEGYKNYIFFLIQMNGVFAFEPNWETDPQFAEALNIAQQSGVTVVLFNADVHKDTINMKDRFYL